MTKDVDYRALGQRVPELVKRLRSGATSPHEARALMDDAADALEALAGLLKERVVAHKEWMVTTNDCESVAWERTTAASKAVRAFVAGLTGGDTDGEGGAHAR